MSTRACHASSPFMQFVTSSPFRRRLQRSARRRGRRCPRQSSTSTSSRLCVLRIACTPPRTASTIAFATQPNRGRVQPRVPLLEEHHPIAHNHKLHARPRRARPVTRQPEQHHPPLPLEEHVDHGTVPGVDADTQLLPVGDQFRHEHIDRVGAAGAEEGVVVSSERGGVVGLERVDQADGARHVRAHIARRRPGRAGIVVGEFDAAQPARGRLRKTHFNPDASVRARAITEAC